MREEIAKLTKAQRDFVKRFVETGNATQAYRDSFSVANRAESTVTSRAAALKKIPKVKAAILKLQNEATDRIVYDVAEVMQHWVDVATADPNELMSYQRRCCRHCYGRGHRYQWRDQDEYAYEAAGVMDANNRLKRGETPLALPDDRGGYGFNFTHGPHPDCPHCRGEGIGLTFIQDTRKLGRKAARLYRGIKQTQHGIQILVGDQDAAVANIAKALGMFTENINLNSKNANLNADVPLPTDPVEAAKVYQLLIKGT